MKSIRQEHEMFSSCIKAAYSYPDSVFSFLDSTEELHHSCHFVMHTAVRVRVKFVLLVTYTGRGIRLLCTEFRYAHTLNEPEGVFSWVAKHFQACGFVIDVFETDE